MSSWITISIKHGMEETTMADQQVATKINSKTLVRLSEQLASISTAKITLMPTKILHKSSTMSGLVNGLLPPTPALFG